MFFINEKERYQISYLFEVQNQTSNYTGVSWNADHKKWKAVLRHKQKKYQGGLFDDEKQAAMKINLLCDENRITRKNSTIGIEPKVIQKVTFLCIVPRFSMVFEALDLPQTMPSA